VAWITGTEFGEVVANIGDPQERVRALQRLDELATAEVLLIDDLGSAHFSEARVTRLFEILDARYRNQLPTAVSTNCGSDELRRQLAGQSRDPGSKLVADRIIRRLTGSPADPRATFVRFAPKPRQSKANPST
jgi:DNA replication protein DnaC